MVDFRFLAIHFLFIYKKQNKQNIEFIFWTFVCYWPKFLIIISLSVLDGFLSSGPSWKQCTELMYFVYGCVMQIVFVLIVSEIHCAILNICSAQP